MRAAPTQALMAALDAWGALQPALSGEVPWHWLLLGGWIALNVATVAVFAHDKRAARRRGARRVPERTLHTLELLGGWPGSLFAQRWLRHKTVKPSYRRAFWGIVALHVAMAAVLCGWWLR